MWEVQVELEVVLNASAKLCLEAFIDSGIRTDGMHNSVLIHVGPKNATSKIGYTYQASIEPKKWLLTFVLRTVKLQASRCLTIVSNISN